MQETEKLILASYLFSDPFNRATTAHIKADYFEDDAAKIIFEDALQYTIDNHSLPTKVVLKSKLESRSNIPEKVFQTANEILDGVYDQTYLVELKNTNYDWLISEAEKWCKERSTYLAILKCIDILDGKQKENGKLLDKAAIPDIMQKAISISFDTSIGHNYIEDAEKRFEFMHQKIAKIPFKIPIMNRITNGGVEKKTVNMAIGGTGSGKTRWMCSLAADYISLGYNVLYITLEMAEEKISERIDANLLNVPMDELKNIPKKSYLAKFDAFRERGYGKLIVKEYPTSSAGCAHFRYLLQELEIKQGFVPDIVFLDYIGIALSSRFKSSDNMYQIQKSISEEFRGLAVERNFAGWTSSQTNRTGFGSSDIDMTDISESFGINMVCDFVIALISTEELVQLGQTRIKQLKNRYADLNLIQSFLLNVDNPKMRIYDGMSGSHGDAFALPKAPEVRQDILLEDKTSDVPVFDLSRGLRRGFGDDMIV